MDQGNASARSNLFDAAREARVWTPLFRTISPTPLRCMSVMVLYGSRGVTVRGGRFRSKERRIESVMIYPIPPMSQCECDCLWDASQCVSYALLPSTRYKN